ncbi:MAG: xanthine dehydrogenase family protein molybdopterin-binding subunit [Bacillota bacterium]
MKKRGKGLSTIMFGFGYGEGFPDYSEASIEIQDNGELLIRTAAADVGQGVQTVVTQIAAEVLNTHTSKFNIVQGDTHTTKNSGSTSATRQTYFTGNAVKNAAQDLLGKIYFYASKEFGTNYPEMRVEEGYAYPLGEEEKKLSFREIAYRVEDSGEELKGEGTFYPETYDYDEKGQGPKTYVAYTFMTQIFEVEVDTDTGLVEVIDVKTALDVGKAINPKNVEGQIEGGTTQGMGMALMEEQVIKEGITLNPNMTGYVVPTSMDVPNFESRLVENADAEGPYGAKGVGEPVAMGASPGIANAIYDAIGVRFTDLPITPEKILAALKNKKGGKNNG